MAPTFDYGGGTRLRVVTSRHLMPGIEPEIVEDAYEYPPAYGQVAESVATVEDDSAMVGDDIVEATPLEEPEDEIDETVSDDDPSVQFEPGIGEPIERKRRKGRRRKSRGR